MSQIGRIRAVGLGKETSWGSAVAPTVWVPLTDSPDFRNKHEHAVKEGMRALIEKTYGSDVIKSWAEGSITGNVGNEGLGLILYAALGAVASVAKAAPNASVYDHTFTVSETNDHQSLTIGIDDAEVGDKQYAGALLNSLEIRGERGGYLMFTANFTSKADASGTLTPSFSTSNYFFRPQDMTFKHATNYSGLGAAGSTSIKSFTLKIEKNAEANFDLGNIAPTAVFNREFSVTLDIELLYENDTLHDYWEAGTARAAQLNITNSDVTIGTSANPNLQVTLYTGKFADWSNAGGVGDIQTQTLTFRADYSSTDAKMIAAVLTNLTTSY